MTNSPTRLLCATALGLLLSCSSAFAQDDAKLKTTSDLSGMNLPPLNDDGEAATTSETPAKPEQQPETAPKVMAQTSRGSDSFYRPTVDGETEDWINTAPEDAPAAEPEQAGDAVDEPAEDRAQPWGGSGIEQGDLGSLTASALDLYSEDAGGFARDLWQNSDLDVLSYHLEQLSVADTTYAEAQLMRRLLLTAADMPDGSTPEATEQFVNLRIAKLVELGAVDDLLALYERLGPQASAAIPGLDELIVSQTLIDKGLSDACALPQNVPHGYAAYDSWWQRLTILCLYRNNDEVEAQRQRAIADELGAIDPLTAALMDRMTGATATLPENVLDGITIDAMHWALYQAIGAERPARMVAQADAITTALVARSASAPFDLALLAAEKGAANGSVSVEGLRQLYSRVALTDASPIQPIETGSTSSPASASSPEAAQARTRAMEMYRIGLLPDDMSRGDAIASALKRAQVEGRFELAARLYAPLIFTLEADERFANTADIFITALLIAGEDKAARQWHDIAVNFARNGGAQGFATLARAWPYLVFAAPEAGARGIQVLAARWLATIGASRDPNQAYQQGEFMFATMEAFGLRVDGAAWRALENLVDAQTAQAIASKTTMPPLPLWHRLNITTANERQGEGLLVALRLLTQTRGTAEAPLNPAVMASIAAGMRQLGTASDAQAMLYAQLVARGL